MLNGDVRRNAADTNAVVCCSNCARNMSSMTVIIIRIIIFIDKIPTN